MDWKTPLIFELSRAGRHNKALDPEVTAVNPWQDLPAELLRNERAPLPELSELQVVRHFTRLSQKNYSIDTAPYPLGSCTMKYNPKIAHDLAGLEGFSSRHPLASESSGQGLMSCLYELQEALANITGMQATCLSPMAGAQGEFAGVAMIRAYHHHHGDEQRDEMLVPDAAHGTNPASATMCGYKVREIPTASNGDLDLEVLKQMTGARTAGIMLTNPSTLGLFERQIESIRDIIHGAGGLMYYDGANLNAIMGIASPARMGFDIMHINLHKTFATPHGCGGPGAGPIAMTEAMLPYRPIPFVIREGETYRWASSVDVPHSIGRLSTFMGNIGVLLRAYVYIRLLGAQGLKRVARHSVLNANFLMQCLRQAGLDLPYKDRRCAHEFIVSLEQLAGDYKVSALDAAKRLLDYGIHAPTVYFPLLVPECMLFEPTETETREDMERLANTLVEIVIESQENPDLLQSSPHSMPIGRLDEVHAARHPDLVWQEAGT